MIKPTIGRIVWFHPAQKHDQPWAAIITYVHSDTKVNLAVFNECGSTWEVTSVPLFQGDTDRPTAFFAEWMPYQTGQAAKTEQLEKELASKV